MLDWGESLRRSGLCNELFGYADVIDNKQKFEFRAFCTSQKCAGKYTRVHKSVVGKPVNCVDCGSALYWVREAL